MPPRRLMPDSRVGGVLLFKEGRQLLYKEGRFAVVTAVIEAGVEGVRESAEEHWYVGVDVCKKRLDVCRTEGRREGRTEGRQGRRRGRMSRVANTAEGCQSLAEELAAAEVKDVSKGVSRLRVVVESTGGYERPLIRALVRVGVAVCHVNPARVRHLAKALGQEAKSDPIDARGLVLYGQLAKPRVMDPAQFTLTDELKQLVARRRQLVELLTMQASHAEHATNAVVLASIEQVTKALETQKAAVEAEVERLVAADAGLRGRREALLEISGIGLVTANTLVTSMPELGRIDRKAVVALAGLAPFVDSSGKDDGLPHIRGGRGDARQALYMATVAGLGHNPVLKAHFHDLVARGKPGKVAMVSCMRKLLLHANAVLAKLEHQRKQENPNPTKND